MKKVFTLLSVFFVVLSFSGQDFRKLFSDTTLLKNDLWKKERLNYYLNADTLNSNDFVGYYQRGVEKMQNDLYLEAIGDFKKSLVEDKQYTENIPSLNKSKPKADALFYVGVCFALLEYNDSSKFYFEKVIETDPFYTDAYLQKASVYYTENNKDKMIEILSRGVESNPRSPDLLYNLGISYMLNNQKHKVKKIQKELIEVFPNYEHSYTLLGMIYMFEQKNKMALKTFSRSIELNPSHAIAYYFRGGIYLINEDYPECYSDFLEYYKLDSTNLLVNEVLPYLDFKMGLNSVGLERLWSDINKQLSDSLTYLRATPWQRELYAVFNDIHSGVATNKELFAIGQFYHNLLWVSYKAASASLNEMYDEFPNSFLIKRFTAYHLNNNLIFHNFESGIDISFIHEVVDDLLELRPEEPNFYFLKSSLYLRKSDDDDCIFYCKKGLELSPDYPYPYHQIGRAFRGLEEYDSALIYHSKAISLCPSFIPPYISKAKLYTEFLNKPNEAIEQYKIALSYPFSRIHDLTDRYDGILEYDLNYDYTLRIAELYGELGEYDSSINYYTQLFKEYTVDIDLLERRGKIYLNAQQYDSAILDFNVAIALYNEPYYKDPGRAATYFERGNSYFYRGSYYSAINDYEEALKIYQNNPIFQAALGDCYRNLGEYDKAIKLYDKSLEGEPDNIWFMYKKAICLTETNLIKESIVCLSNAIRIDTSFSDAYAYIGWNYYQLGKYKMTLHFSKKALSLNPYSCNASFNIGLALIRLGYYEKAYEIYKQTKSVNDLEPNVDYESYISELKNLLADDTLKPEVSKILYEVFQVSL